MFAGYSSRSSGRILAKKLQAPGLGTPEPLHFEDDSFGRSLADTQNAPGQIAALGPQVNERALAFGAQLAVEGRKFREPFTVLVHFGEAGLREGIKSVAEFGPFIHRQTAITNNV